MPSKTSEVKEYFESVKKELILNKNIFHDRIISTIYFGGGTPSRVDAEHIYDLIKFVEDNFNIDPKAEYSIETSPETLDEHKLKIYKKAGFKRISIGLQATQNQILKFIGRLHTVEEFESKFKMARDVGFNNINVDLIFGMPKQTFVDWTESLEYIAKLNPEHVATYSLIIDTNSTFGKLYRMKKLKPAPDYIDRKMYKFGKRFLKSHGYNHYEIANFAKSGYESNHNSGMWRGNDYYGAGASAYSKIGNRHFSNVSNINKYITDIYNNALPHEYLEELSSEDEMWEYLMLRLRLINEGIDFQEFYKRYKKDFMSLYSTQITKLQKEGMVKTNKNRIVLSAKGMDFENYVGGELTVFSSQ